MFSLILHGWQYGIVSHPVRKRMGVKKNYEKFNKKTQIGWKWTQKNKRPMILFKSDIDKDNNPAKRGKMLPH